MQLNNLKRGAVLYEINRDKTASWFIFEVLQE